MGKDRIEVYEGILLIGLYIITILSNTSHPFICPGGETGKRAGLTLKLSASEEI